MISSVKCAVGFASSSPIILDRSEPYKGQFSIFYLDKIWNDDRYWEPSPGSTLHDSNNGWSKFDDLSLFLYKM